MDEFSKDFKKSGKKISDNSPFEQYTKHFNYSVFPNFKVYSLSTQPVSNPIESAAASAAADTHLPFSDPQPIVKALPSKALAETDHELERQRFEKLKQQHLNLQEQLGQHKTFISEAKLEKQRTEPPVGVFFPEEIAPRPQQKATESLVADTQQYHPSTVTETLFPPRTTHQESSKSILFGAFTDRMSNNGSALVLAAGPIGDADDMRNKVRSVTLQIRKPVADYQAKNGLPIQQQISFVDLIRMLFVCSQTAVFTILTMLWNLYPLLDGFLYVLRFVLDKILYVCQGQTSTERVYRSCIFAGEVVILLLANLFIINVIVMPITSLILCTMGNCMRLMGLY